MYRYYVAFLLCLLCYVSKGQNIYNTLGKPTSLTIINGQLTAPRLKAPTSFSSSAPYFSDTGNIAVVGGLFYYYNGSGWVAPSGGGVDSAALADSMQFVRANYLKVMNGIGLTNTLDANGYPITGINTPVNPGDAVPYNFLQQFLTGLAWKASVLAVTTTDLPTYTFDGINSLIFPNGVCPTIDGKTVRLNSRILYKNGVGDDTMFNGIYTVTQLGNVSTQCIFTRSSDANTALTLNRATVSADSGLVNMGKAFTEASTITTINTSPVTFVPILDAVAQAGRGLGKAGNVGYVDSTVALYVHAFIDSMTHYFAKKDSNTHGNPITLDYFNSHFPAAGVSSVFTRTGAVTAQAGDYTFAQIGSKPTTVAGYGITDAGTVTSVNATSGTGISISGGPITGAGSFNITNTAPDQTVTITDAYANIITGTYPNFTIKNDSSKQSTKAYRQKGIDSVVGLITAGYITPGVIVGYNSYSVAGTYTVTVPAGAKSCIVRGVGAGGGAGACVGAASGNAVSGGGGAGAPFEHVYTSIGWSSGTLVLAAGGTAGAITGCPSCVGANGGNGGTSTWADGTVNISIPGGNGSPTTASASAGRTLVPGFKTNQVTGANKLNGEGACGGFGWMFASTSTGVNSGNGGDAGDWGKGGTSVNVSNTAGNNGTGNGSGGSGCISAAGTGSTNCKNGGAGTDARVDFIWFK